MNSDPESHAEMNSPREPAPSGPGLSRLGADSPVPGAEDSAAPFADVRPAGTDLRTADSGRDGRRPDVSLSRDFSGWAWLVIVALVSGMIVMGQQQKHSSSGDAEPAALAVMEVQMKYFVGALQFSEMQRGLLYQQARLLNRGPLGQRLYFVVLSGELAGPAEALENLKDLEQKLGADELTAAEPQQREFALLENLYADYAARRWDAPSVSEDEREWYRQRHGWVARLALTPAEAAGAQRTAVLSPARRTVIVAMAASLVGILLLLAGIVLLVVFGVLILGRDLHSAMLAATPYGGIYAETFAVWMVLFLLLGVIAGFLPLAEQSLAVSGGIFALSLLSLLWPVWRGASWARVRRDIGWCTRSPIWLEPIWGICCYIASLPLVAVGFLIVLLALQAGGALPVGSAEAGPAQMPTHPIIHWMREASWVGRLQVMLLACIAAPVVEETVFRGVLYRHLRQATWRWRLGASVGFSSVLNSLIFAAIHPQGLIAIPALAALALGFSLAREWRGSLIAPMAAHAANNFLLTLTLVLVL